MAEVQKTLSPYSTTDQRTRYESLKQDIQDRLSGKVAAENPDAHTTVSSRTDERLVQAIWNEQLLSANQLVSCSGKLLRVFDPGRWNHEGGPDFRTAEIEIAGKRVRGDVEIHVDSADWNRHQHGTDFEYNTVVLHAFLNKTDAANFDELQNGQRAERLELSRALSPDLETIRRSLTPDDLLGDHPKNELPCRANIAAMPPELLRDFFLEAGRQRIESKIARFAAHSAGETADQVLYQAILTAMGYKGGKTLFFLLAKRTPIEELKRYLRDVPLTELPVALEAILLNVANLIPGNATHAGDCSDSPFDSETQDYLNQLNRWWSELSGYFLDRIIPPTRRWFTNVRPVNFPARRIAGVARLLAMYDFRRGLADAFLRRVEDARARQPKSSRDFKREIQQLCLMFADEGGYWARRYTLGGNPSKSVMRLIGEDRAASVFFNAVVPNLIFTARNKNDAASEEFIWRLYDHFPALPENVITKFMRTRLFGQDVPYFTNVKLERFNQALFQVFSDCCGNNALTCDDCTFCKARNAG